MKNQFDIWNQFAMTGNVTDYLCYKNLECNEVEKRSREGEKKNESTHYSHRNGIICDANG